MFEHLLFLREFFLCFQIVKLHNQEQQVGCQHFFGNPFILSPDTFLIRLIILLIGFDIPKKIHRNNIISKTEEPIKKERNSSLLLVKYLLSFD